MHQPPREQAEQDPNQSDSTRLPDELQAAHQSIVDGKLRLALNGLLGGHSRTMGSRACSVSMGVSDETGNNEDDAEHEPRERVEMLITAHCG